MNKLSPFSAQCVFDVYNLMKDCASIDHIEDNDFVCSVFEKIRRYKLAIPPAVYNSIEAFVAEFLYPIVDDTEYFALMHCPEYGTFKNGVFVIDSDASLEKILAVLFEIVDELDKRIDRFAEAVLMPYFI